MMRSRILLPALVLVAVSAFGGAILAGGVEAAISPGLLILVLLALGICFYLVHRAVAPIEDLGRSAAQLSDDAVFQHAWPGAPAEIVPLLETLRTLSSERAERGRLLEEQRREFGALLANLLEGVLFVDPDERIAECNPVAAEIFGLRAEAVEGRPLGEIIRSAPLQAFVARILAGENPRQEEIVTPGSLAPAPGASRVLRIQGVALRESSGRVAGALVVFGDLTRLRHLEMIRRDFVANVSHELKTPITSIKGYIETLKDGAVNDPENAPRFLEIALRQADRLNAIIEDLLALSRIEQDSEGGSIELQPGSIRAVLDAAVQLCAARAEQSGITLTLECAPDLAARLNPPLLEQAVTNLIDNAVKYSETGKNVRIEAGRENGHIAIRVSDQGCGIAREHLDRLFERFYRVDKARSRKLGGTGLGLAIVKHIVQAHGGTVAVESEVGKGSCFTIRL
jgi:two-component system, OmpR family, phosphate regulon sensor histidine kinase PhoR